MTILSDEIATLLSVVGNDDFPRWGKSTCFESLTLTCGYAYKLHVSICFFDFYHIKFLFFIHKHEKRIR